MKKLTTILALICVALGLGAQTKYDFSKLKMEELGRGVIAVRQSPSEVFVTWRYLQTDPAKAAFDVYRDGKKVNKAPIKDVSFFVDSNSSYSAAKYEVRPSGKKVDGIKSGSYTLPANAPTGYLPIALDTPAEQVMPNGEKASYTPNDCSLGDVDGDGEYEIILKWDPSNAHDNAHTGYTGTVFFDCLKLDGTRLWRIDLGRNIRAGAHYTQFLVYDFDGDGKAEVIMKTSDGTVDGTGKVIGNPDADYREHGKDLLGRIMSGNEYLTVFNGLTGAAMKTIDYLPGRGENGSWGDRNANRSDRYLAGVAYLDGAHPSAVMCRGYYTRATLAAYDWDGKDLKLKWFFDSNSKPEYKKYEGQGNHNLRVADVDSDGCDEIIYGSCCIDHNGEGLYSNGYGHGDSMHLGQFYPGYPGLQVWIGHESRGVGSTLTDARTGKVLFRIPGTSDVGRSMAADIDPTHPGWEMWSSDSNGMRDIDGKRIGNNPASVNFAVWWDGELSRELLDGNRIHKFNAETGESDLIMRFEGASSINGSKSVPNLSADILGDWREEVLLRSQDNKELRLYVSTLPSEYRFHTFMLDPVYRTSVANENVCYNQPPEAGFYFGTDLAGVTFRGTALKGKKVKYAPKVEDTIIDERNTSARYAQEAQQTNSQGQRGNGPNGTPAVQNQRPQGAQQGQRPQGAPQMGPRPQGQMPQGAPQMGQRPQGAPQMGQRPAAMQADNSYKDNTPDSLDLAKTARPVAGSSRKGNNPVLFLVGDSTMRTGTRGNGDNGQWGWGYHMHKYFDENKITVENHALGGLSSRTFYTGWWPDVIKGVQKGDYVIVQIGHNDSGPYDTPFGRSAIPGSGKETVQVTDTRTNKVETVYTYGEYLRKYVNEVRAKGAYPILMTLTPRNQREENGSIRRKNDSYNIWIKDVVKELNVPFVDFESISASKFESFDSKKVDYMFYNDNIHSSTLGAAHNAQCAAEGIAACKETDLGKYLLPFSVSVPKQEFKREKGKPALIVTGDSTIQNNDSDPNGMWGWGSVLETVFDPSRITLVNAGKAGRSARTFMEEGRWDKVYNAIEPGDYVVIQFGHNDLGQPNAAPFRGELQGTGDEKQNFFMTNDRMYKVVYTYGWYLRKFIMDVREKGGIPILCSITPRNEWPEGKIERRNDSFGVWMKEIVDQTGVDFIDIHNITADYYDSIGAEATKAYYKNDHTHSSKMGAERNAKSFAEGLKKAGHSLANYLK